MTPTEQTRLNEIRKSHEDCGGTDCAHLFLLSLLSQETKRADEAEARAYTDAAQLCATTKWSRQEFVEWFDKKAAAVRRGREGEQTNG